MPRYLIVRAFDVVEEDMPTSGAVLATRRDDFPGSPGSTATWSWTRRLRQAYSSTPLQTRTPCGARSGARTARCRAPSDRDVTPADFPDCSAPSAAGAARLPRGRRPDRPARLAGAGTSFAPGRRPDELESLAVEGERLLFAQPRSACSPRDEDRSPGTCHPVSPILAVAAAASPTSALACSRKVASSACRCWRRARGRSS